MAKLLMPFSPQSPTAINGQRALRDENIYSAGLLQHGAAGQLTLFTSPKGQPLPALRGAVVASANAWQTTYTLQTTNLVKAGEPGSSLGDLAVRSIGITLEPAAHVPTTGAQRAWGATQFEVADILSKVSLEFKVGGKKVIEGPTFLFPGHGAPQGSVSTTGNAQTVGVVNNGSLGMGRFLKLPIPVARTDTIEGNVIVAAGSTLAFSSAAADGQPTLVWVTLLVMLSGDPR